MNLSVFPLIPVSKSFKDTTGKEGGSIRMVFRKRFVSQSRKIRRVSFSVSLNSGIKEVYAQECFVTILCQKFFVL